MKSSVRPKLIPNPNQKYLQRIIQAKDFGNKLRLLQAVSDEVAERVLKVKGKPWGFLLRAKWAKKITVRWGSEVKRIVNKTLTKIHKLAASGSSWWSISVELAIRPSHASLSRPPQKPTELKQFMTFSSALQRYLCLKVTYDVKLENLADFGVCGHLAVKVARVRRIGEFQLQRILPASGGWRGSIRTISNSSIDPITSINHNLYLLQSWSTSRNPINGISQEFHSNTQWLVTYTYQCI